MAQKQNLLDLQKLGIMNGEIEEGEVRAFDRNSVILTFSEVNGLISSEHMGRPVYPLVSDHMIGAGTWIVVLQPGHDEYRAKGVRKLDASFFMELKQSQRQAIIDSLWGSNRELIMQYMEEKFASEVEAKVAEAADVATKPLKEEIEQLKSERERLQHELDLNRVLLQAKQSQPSPVPVDKAEDIELSTGLVVRRTAEGKIHSDSFTSMRYFAHISYDRKVMFIQPHEYGKVICLEGTLYLTKLGDLVPFTCEQELRSEEVPGKGYYVYFD